MPVVRRNRLNATHQVRRPCAVVGIRGKEIIVAGYHHDIIYDLNLGTPELIGADVSTTNFGLTVDVAYSLL